MEEQHIRIKAILEILGKPQEYIESKMKEYLTKIKEDENLMIVNESISEPKEDNNVFSMFAEIELVIKGVTNMTGFCIEYMPSSIEVIKPESFTFAERDFTAFVNDMLAKLHRVDMIAKKLGTQNTILSKNMNGLIRNNLLILIRFGINEMEGIVKSTGIDGKEIKLFLDKLLEEGRITEDNGIYSIV